jgi:hypothetical protein
LSRLKEGVKTRDVTNAVALLLVTRKHPGLGQDFFHCVSMVEQ